MNKILRPLHHRAIFLFTVLLWLFCLPAKATNYCQFADHDVQCHVNVSNNKTTAPPLYSVLLQRSGPYDHFFRDKNSLDLHLIARPQGADSRPARVGGSLSPSSGDPAMCVARIRNGVSPLPNSSSLPRQARELPPEIPPISISDIKMSVSDAACNHSAADRLFAEANLKFHQFKAMPQRDSSVDDIKFTLLHDINLKLLEITSANRCSNLAGRLLRGETILGLSIATLNANLKEIRGPQHMRCGSEVTPSCIIEYINSTIIPSRTDIEKKKLLREVAFVKVFFGEIEEAAQFIMQIPDSTWHDKTFEEIIISEIHKKNYENANRIIKYISDPKKNIDLTIKIGEASGDLHVLSDAIQKVKLLQNPYYYANLFRGRIAIVYARENALSQARLVAQEIDQPVSKVQALESIGLISRNAHIISEAKTMAGTLSNLQEKTGALMRIASSQAKLGRFQDAVETACSITASNTQSRVFGEIVKHMTEFGLFEQAMSLFRIYFEGEMSGRSDNAQAKTQALAAIAIEQARAGHAMPALESLNRIPHSSNKQTAMEQVARALTDAGNISGAWTTLSIMGPDAARKERVMRHMIQLLSNAEDYAQALDTAMMIRAPDRRSEALSHVVRSLISKGYVEHAITVIERIDNPALRAALLHSAALAYVQQGQNTKAQHIAQNLEYAVPRIRIIISIAQSTRNMSFFNDVLLASYRVMPTKNHGMTSGANDLVHFEDLILEIATGQAVAGFSINAIQTTMMIFDDYIRALYLIRVSRYLRR
jgi:hypothetical protein